MLESFVQKEKIRGQSRDSCLSEGILERSPDDNCRRIPFFLRQNPYLCNRKPQSASRLTKKLSLCTNSNRFLYRE